MGLHENLDFFFSWRYYISRERLLDFDELFLCAKCDKLNFGW